MITAGMIGPWQIILILCGFLIPIIALIDVIRNDFTKNNKIVWILVILFASILGVLLYLIFGTSQKIKNSNENE
ncbi:PLD nuclease N-terminal domain-containing protein [uncultured Lutibacter sp.]|uniref:PLD nuclease N-terminal domain-containing protein n=1 Tax=uncultured Lutibacter sp. TaxID=437739 RepID=UPI00261F1BFC|nr:PLD nuclease N-terminal domain-containing protein [uncultured Lutibacter sp.]